MLWNPDTAREIGVDWLLAEIAPAGELGRRARERERPFRRGDEAAARALLARVDRLARAHSREALETLAHALANAPDLGALVARASAGNVLEDVDFFECVRFFDALGEVARTTGDDGFARSAPALDALRKLLEAGRTPARTFYLSDAFDPSLKGARDAAAAAQAAYDGARSRLATRVAHELQRETLGDGEFVVMREALHGPLPAGVHVVREAPTYFLCELMLDPQAVAALEARTSAGAHVAECEETVRMRLTQAVAAAAADIERALEALGAMDALVARARFTQRYGASVPEVGEATRLAFVEARFLPLESALEAAGHRYAPIALELEGVGVLTGPNMGGKTAALRTCGFVAACAALGVPVSARSATAPLYDEIAWVGAGEALAESTLLSAFGREVVELRAVLESAAARKLVLVDEFARTTSPREGRALLVALLEVLRDRGASALAATHFVHVAGDAGVAHYAIGGLRALPARAATGTLALDDALERIAEVMDYRVARIAEDAPPHADALALADVLGLDAEVIARARAAL